MSNWKIGRKQSQIFAHWTFQFELQNTLEISRALWAKSLSETVPAYSFRMFRIVSPEDKLEAFEALGRRHAWSCSRAGMWRRDASCNFRSHLVLSFPTLLMRHLVITLCLYLTTRCCKYAVHGQLVFRSIDPGRVLHGHIVAETYWGARLSLIQTLALNHECMWNVSIIIMNTISKLESKTHNRLIGYNRRGSQGFHHIPLHADHRCWCHSCSHGREAQLGFLPFE